MPLVLSRRAPARDVGAPRFGWLLGLARTPVLCLAQSPAKVPEPIAALSADQARQVGEGPAPMGRYAAEEVDSGAIGNDSADR